MTDQHTTSVIEVARALQTVLATAEVEAPDNVVCDALLVIAVSAAEQAAPPAQIARTFTSLAERYLMRAKIEATGQTETVTDTAHAALSSAVSMMKQNGIDDAYIRELMLGFVMAWISRSDPAASAALLYRHADALAGRVASTH